MTKPERDILAELQEAAARKWTGDPAAQQAGLFARAVDEVQRLRLALHHVEAGLSAAAEDAARYRWLRDNASCQWDLDYQHVEVVFPLDEEEWTDMDDAVDRAMAATAAVGAA